MKVTKKVLVSLLIVIMLVMYVPIAKLEVKAIEGENGGVFETLDDYLAVYYPGQAKEKIKTLNIVSGGDTIKIKNMESLKQMTNLKILEISGIYCNEIDLQGLDNLIYLDLRWVYSIDTSYTYMLVKNINTLSNLKFLNLCQVAIDGTIKGECFNELLEFETWAYSADTEGMNPLEIENINYMENLRKLYLDRVVCDELDFNKINKLTSIDYRARFVKVEEGSQLEELNLSEFKLPTTVENVYFELDAYRTTGILNLNSLTNLRTFRFDFHVDTNEDLNNSIEASNLNVDNIAISAYIYADNRTILEEAKIENYIKLSNYDNYMYHNFNLSSGCMSIVKFRKNINYGNFIDNALNTTNFYGTEFELNEIDDFTGMEYFDTLENLYIEKAIANFDVRSFPNLTELTLEDTEITQGLDLRNSSKLEKFSANYLTGDLSNVVINANQLSEFYLSYIPNESSGFELEKCILIDDYEKIRIEEYNSLVTYEYNEEYYYTIEEFLANKYPETPIDEITHLEIGDGTVIKDYSGLATLPNLTSLNFWDINLKGIDFSIVPNLVDISIYNCTLNGTLNFTGNDKLENIDVNLAGDLTNAIVDIRGLTNLERFNYEYYTDEASNFDLDRCILRDNTFELIHSSNADIMYENYYYIIGNPDNPEYPEYIISNLNTYEIEDGTSVIYGFVLNEEKTLTVGDILSRNYFAEDITAKIFEDGTEVTNTQEVVGTGTVIKLYEGEELVEEYTMVIFGDTTGDGLINAVDALAIIKNKNQNVLFENKILEEAGKVTEKTYYEVKIPSAVDALAIIKYINGRYDIDQRDYYYGIGGPVG